MVDGLQNNNFLPTSSTTTKANGLNVALTSTAKAAALNATASSSSGQATLSGTGPTAGASTSGVASSNATSSSSSSTPHDGTLKTWATLPNRNDFPSTGLSPEVAAAYAKRREEEAAWLLSKKRPRTKEDNAVQQATKERFSKLLLSDQAAVLQPDIETPFKDASDVIHRLLPYHVFNQSERELKYATETLIAQRNGTWKGKAKELAPHLQGLALENAGQQRKWIVVYFPDFQRPSETELAVELHTNLRSLKDRYRSIRVKEADDKTPKTQSYLAAQISLDAERESLQLSQALLREAQARKSSQDRPLSTPTSMSTPTWPRPQYPLGYPASAATPYSTPAGYPANPAYQAYYQQYAAAMAGIRLPYAMPYSYGYNNYLPGATSHFPTPSTTSSVPATPISSVPTSTAATPTNSTPTSYTAAPFGPPNASLPLSIPSSALESLRAVGITPVSAKDISSTPGLQPAVVLLGHSPDGSIANLTINLSKLEVDQRGKLGVVLQSLVKPNATPVASTSS